MALQSSGEIRFSQIRDEFGESGPGSAVSLGRYRKNSIHFTNKVIGRNVNNRLGSYSNYLPLDINCGPNADTPIGETGQIKATDFYNGQLNMVVDLYSGDTDFRIDCRNIYLNDNNGSTVKCVGGFRFRPSNSAAKRVIVYVAKTFGSEANTHITTCAVKTGDWNPTTNLDIEIGPNGKIYGAGGDGGDGGSANGSGGQDGKSGSSALGVQYPCSINNLGRIQAGYGGGGGGGGKREYRKSGKKSGRWAGSSGGGGGGGAGVQNSPGWTSSFGGNSPQDSYGGGGNGSDGGDGVDITSGNGGNGGQEAGDGGDGAAVNNTSTKGDNGTNNGGTGGANGWAIITTNATTDYTVSGSGSVVGRQKANVIVY